MKKVFTASALLLLFPMVVLAHYEDLNAPRDPLFRDVPGNHLYHEGIEYVTENRFIDWYKNMSFHPEKYITRMDFLIATVNSIFATLPEETVASCTQDTHPRDTKNLALKRARYLCLAEKNGIINKHASSTFHGAKGKKPITLPDAADMLIRALGAEGGEDNLPDEPYRQNLTLLEEFNALPPTLLLAEDKLTRGEAAEMIYRMREGMTEKGPTDRPAASYHSLLKRGPWKGATFFYDHMEEFFRLADDSEYGFTGGPLTASHIRQLFDIGSYRIINVPNEGPQALGGTKYDEPNFTNDCGVFNASQVELASSGKRKNGVPEDFTVTFFNPFAGQCKEYRYDDDGIARVARANARYELTLSLHDGKLAMESSHGDRVRILRESIEKLPLSWNADNSVKEWYEYTRVDTQGTVSTKTLPSGKTVYVYRTAWQPIFNSDMPGASYFSTEKKLPSDKYWKKLFVFAPAHNMSSWNPKASYEKCLEFPQFEAGGMPAGSYDFCFKHEGNELVVASPWELGDRFTLRIDERWEMGVAR